MEKKIEEIKQLIDNYEHQLAADQEERWLKLGKPEFFGITDIKTKNLDKVAYQISQLFEKPKYDTSVSSLTAPADLIKAKREERERICVVLQDLLEMSRSSETIHAIPVRLEYILQALKGEGDGK